jgi:hypothetical protein
MQHRFRQRSSCGSRGVATASTAISIFGSGCAADSKTHCRSVRKLIFPLRWWWNEAEVKSTTHMPVQKVGI